MSLWNEIKQTYSTPDNNKIYSPTDLDDLEKSLSEFGQLNRK